MSFLLRFTASDEDSALVDKVFKMHSTLDLVLLLYIITIFFQLTIIGNECLLLLLRLF